MLLALSLALAIGATAGEDDPAAASTVTIRERGIRLDDALRRLREGTGNAVTDLRGAGASNPALDLDLEAAPFLRALDEIATRAGVAVTPFTGDGSMGIVAGGGADAARPPTADSGPFRIALKRIALLRDFEAGSSSARIALEIGWEPRLRPMLLSIKADGVEAIDDRGRAVPPQVAMESGDVALRSENPSVEANVTLAAPDRSARMLSRLRIRAEATVPADARTFEFPALDREATLRQGGVSATLRPVEVDQQVWKVTIELAYPDGGPALESFRQGLLENRVRLRRADGSTIEPRGGSVNVGTDGGRVGFEHLFIDAPGKPGDYRLVCEAPGAIVAVPIDATFRDVPLP